MVLNVFFFGSGLCTTDAKLHVIHTTVHCNPLEFPCPCPGKCSCDRSLGQVCVNDWGDLIQPVFGTLPTGVCLILPARFRLWIQPWVGEPSPTHCLGELWGWFHLPCVREDCTHRCPGVFACPIWWILPIWVGELWGDLHLPVIGKRVHTGSVGVFALPDVGVNTALEWVNLFSYPGLCELWGDFICLCREDCTHQCRVVFACPISGEYCPWGVNPSPTYFWVNYLLITVIRPVIAIDTIRQQPYSELFVQITY